MTLALEQYYAAQADALARKEDRMGQLYGGPDSPQLIKLRCFKYYHPDTGSWLTAPDGRDRWMGPKASRIYAILHRASSSGVGRTTMTAVASEAMASTSTVSRTVQRLQAFGFFAIDVIRGRNGGIVVRRRSAGDAMKHYAAAAWKRIRSWINVASRSPGSGDDLVGSTSRKDATFTEDQLVERLGERVRTGEITIEEARRLAGRDRAGHTEADRQHDRAVAWALEVLEERRRLALRDPMGEYEAVNAYYITGER